MNIKVEVEIEDNIKLANKGVH